MGAYLSVPVTEKVSNDEEGKFLAYGASSMQGWRVSQEDAHNSIIDFEDQTHLFAVYDGHGGHEVAAYAALKLPEFIKEAVDYNEKEHIPECLKKAFLDFDATLVKPDVVNVLKQIAGTKDDDSDDDEEDEEVDNLFKEATMPLDEVMAKYAENPHLVRCKTEKKGVSPFLRAKPGTSESHSNEPPIKFDVEAGETSESDNPETSTSKQEETNVTDKVSAKEEEEEEESEGNQNGVEAQSSSHMNGGETKHINGEVKEENSEEAKAEDENASSENDDKVLNGGEELKLGKGKSLKGGKGKSLLKNSEVQALKEAKSNEKKRMAAVKAAEIYRKLQEGASEEELSDEEDEDEDDDNFEDDAEDDEEEEEGDDDSDEDDDDDDDDDDDEEEVDEGDPNAEFAMNMKEEPGFDSGCTACLALLRGTELYVANVGDSRIVVCREGKAIDMSVDHKPEDDPESSRIVKAGGRVTDDGRVNGGLNLSRAFGDHGYKQNKNLTPEEQMISPLPDVRSMVIGPKDEFMIVACDGIWNSLSSQDACDFVSERLTHDVKLSTICEELFDECLAPDTLGDGTGCDNMTCIIVKFKDLSQLSSGSAKRTSDEAENDELKADEKKLKCDDK